MHPRYPRQFDASERFARQLQTQHDVDIKRLWDAQRAHLNPYSGTSDIDLPANPTTTTSTTTGDPRCCDAYSCADAFIPDVLDVDGVTTIPGGWFRLSGASCTMNNGATGPGLPVVSFGQFDVPGVGLRWVLTYLPQGATLGAPQLEWYFADPIGCPGPNNSTSGAQKNYLEFPALGAITETATLTWVSCSDPTSTTTTTSTTTAEPTTTTTTTTTSTSSTTPGDLPTTTTTSTTTAGGGGGTTTTTSTTTAAPGDCSSGVCLWEWTIQPGFVTPYWLGRITNCAAGCGCNVPPRNGLYLGEIYEGSCA